MISNDTELLDVIYQKQVKKFGETTPEELWRKLRGEIIEYQQALKNQFLYDSPQSRLDVMLEQADIIILANRLYQEFQDELAWLILDKMYNFETARFVSMKWDIVEKRRYRKDKNGNWQHIKEYK